MVCTAQAAPSATASHTIQRLVAGLIDFHRLAALANAPRTVRLPTEAISERNPGQDERPQKADFLPETVKRGPARLGIVFQMPRDAGERLVMNETGPETRIVKRLIQIPRRRNRDRASEYDRQPGKPDRFEARQHKHGQRRDNKRDRTSQPLAQNRETARHTSQRAKAPILARAQYRIERERQKKEQWRVGRAVTSAARDEEVKLQRRQRRQRPGQPSSDARCGKINQKQRRQAGNNRGQPRRELAFPEHLE